MASDHDESDDDEFAGLNAASETSWSAPAPTRSRKRGRKSAVDADDAAPPAAAWTRRRLAPSREGASPARRATPRGAAAAGAPSAPTPASDAGSMQPPPPRRVVEASDDASDEDDDHMPSLSAKANFPPGHVYDVAPSAPKPKGRGSSKYYGVTRIRRAGTEWIAQIRLGKKLGYDPPKTKYIGYYSTELAAAQAVDLYIHEHVRSLSAKANFPPGHVYDVAPSAPKPKGRGSSKYYGVTRTRRAGTKWIAKIRLGKKLGYNPPKTKNIGYYSTELAAAQAVDDYIYANLPGLIPMVNFPRGN